MGHLINPISLRIGKFSSWEDLWYFNFIYYPEYLHIFLKIRFFILYFFSAKFFEKFGFFYSHFQIIKKYKNLFICSFLFNGSLEESIDDFLSSYYSI